MNDRVNIPDPPAEWSRGVDYREELKLARFSRASYLDEIAISNPDPDVNPDGWTGQSSVDTQLPLCA